MKPLLTGSLFVFLVGSVASAMSLDLQTVAGTYRIYHGASPVAELFTVKTNGQTIYHMRNEREDIRCSGQATLTGGLLKTILNCPDGKLITEAIDFKDVDFTAPAFLAPVFNSLNGVERTMTIEHANRD